MTGDPAPQAPDSAADRPVTATVGDWAAAALVFGSSAAVLVVEIVALRLLAPYLGLTLETSTLVIGLALAAIALGSWLGGKAADRIDPRRTLAPLLAASGAAVAATPFVVRAAGATADGAFLLLASAVTIMVPGALLSAVTPMVTKLRLTSLTKTGTIVGRLSSIGTAGAIVGTVVTGFVLITWISVTAILVGLGVLLLVAAAAVAFLLGHSRRHVAAGAAAALVLGGAAVLTPSRCDAETVYHCALVRADQQRPTGRTLVLDGLQHSYVDVADPSYLRFAYIKAMAAAIDTHTPGPAAVAAHYIGGGGMTMPRWVGATRPGSTGSVSEIDPGVVAIDRQYLALPDDIGLDVRIEDGRVGLRALPADSVDLVVGDAFGGVSVPWHLTTRQTAQGVDAALRDEGIYTLNVIDYPPLAFARAQVATLRTVFPHVAVAASAEAVQGNDGGNLVLLASRSPLDVAGWQSGLRAHDLQWQVLEGQALTDWVGDAPVLTDDYAPVDQLLTPYPASVRV